MYIGVCVCQRQLLCSKDFTRANFLRFAYSATIQNVRNGQSHLTTAVNKEDGKAFKRETWRFAFQRRAFPRNWISFQEYLRIQYVYISCRS